MTDKNVIIHFISSTAKLLLSLY